MAPNAPSGKTGTSDNGVGPFTNEADLEEWAAASDLPDLTAEDLARLDELYERNFDVEPALS